MPTVDGVCLYPPCTTDAATDVHMGNHHGLDGPIIDRTKISGWRESELSDVHDLVHELSLIHI